MEQTCIVEAGHDRHECIQSCTIFRRPSATRRAECWQTDPDEMRETRLRLAASTGCTESQAGSLAIALGTGLGKLIRQPGESSRCVCEDADISLRRSLGRGGDQQTER